MGFCWRIRVTRRSTWDRLRNSQVFWEWPEHEFAKRHNIVHVRLDQGALGHVRKEPTYMTALAELDGMISRDLGEKILQPLQDRMKQSASWAAWAPGLVKALKLVIPRFLKAESQSPNLKKLDVEGWKNHIQSQHFPMEGIVKLVWKLWGRLNRIDESQVRRQLSRCQLTFVVRSRTSGCQSEER